MKRLIAIAIVVILGAAAWFTLAPAQTAPNVTFTALDGKQFNTENLQGKVTLIKFWATTCTTCVKQMPEMVKYYNTYKDQGYNMVAVAMSYDPPEAVKKFTERRQLPFTVTLDDGSAASAFDNVRFTPVAFLLDRQGHIVKRFIGNYDTAEFERTLQQTLAKS